MKTAAFIVLLVAASALAEPNHEVREVPKLDADWNNANILPAKHTKPPKPTKPTTTRPTTTTTTEQVTTTTEEATTALPPTIGDFELVGNFGYYKLHKESVKWNEAWLACIEQDSHLLVIRTQEEYNALYQWKKNEMPPYVYYGAHHNYANHKFVTVFDEPLESLPYHKWGWDYSNATYFNNKDFPTLIIDLSISLDSSDIYLTSRYNNYYRFICKKNIV